MANKRTQELQRREHNKKMYEYQCSKLKWFYIAALVVAAVSLLLYFVPWTQNVNSGSVEFQINGWAFIFATISGSYSASTWGSLAVPLYSHAPSYTIALGVITLLSLVALIIAVVLYVVALVKKKNNLVYAALAAQVIFFILIIAAMVTALLFNESGVYQASASAVGVNYCDPATCSMRTWTYFPVAAALIGMVVSIIAAAKYSSAKRLLY